MGQEIGRGGALVLEVSLWLCLSLGCDVHLCSHFVFFILLAASSATLGVAYTDYRVLHFFHSFKLVSVSGVSRFEPRRREEVKRLWERYYDTRPSYATV